MIKESGAERLNVPCTSPHSYHMGNSRKLPFMGAGGGIGRRSGKGTGQTQKVCMDL
jgi:hypothetical protein